MRRGEKKNRFWIEEDLWKRASHFNKYVKFILSIFTTIIKESIPCIQHPFCHVETIVLSSLIVVVITIYFQPILRFAPCRPNRLNRFVELELAGEAINNITYLCIDIDLRVPTVNSTVIIVVNESPNQNTPFIQK